MSGPITPHLREFNFLTPGEHTELLAWTLANEARFAPAALADRIVDTSVRNALTLRDLGPMRDRLKARIDEATPGWIAALRLTPFETSDIDIELAAHNDGGRFLLHSDTYVTAQKARGDRMLSATYYFHREPKGFAGGCLRLHRLGATSGDAGVDVPPDQNSLVIFPSWGPHEVLPITCPSRAFADSRFSVNCWVQRARIGGDGA